MSGSLYGIYGASGCGRGIMPLVREQLLRAGVLRAQIVFIDDAPLGPSVNGHQLMGCAEFLATPANERYAAIAIADGGVRARLAEKLGAAGVQFFSPRADNVVIMDQVDIGPGACLSPFVTLTSNISIGQHFHANLYSYVEHDCQIGDFVTFAPGVKCNGNLRIEDHVYVGAGAVLKQGKPGDKLVIGRGAVIGMGAVVTRSVPAGATVVGNPARAIARNAP